MKRTQTALICSLLLAWAASTSHAQTPLGPGFTYQGQLKQSGVPLNGTVNLRFSLWDAAGSGSPPVGGNQVGGTQQITNVPISNGVFTVTLNDVSQFGSTAFNGQARWLQIEVCSDASCVTRTTLAPRQPVTVAPYAAFAAAPWVTSGSDVSYTNGNVGIGVGAPLNKLHLVAATNGDGVRLTGTGTNSPGYHLFDGTSLRGDLGLALQAGDYSTSAALGDIVLRAVTGKLLLQTGLNAGLTISGNQVGIGTTAPNAALHVKQEPTTASGTLALEGTTHTYMSFYPDGFAAGRKGFLGFPCSSCNDISLTNQVANGNISLAGGSGGAVNVVEKLNINTTTFLGAGLQITGNGEALVLYGLSGHTRVGYMNFSDRFNLRNDFVDGHGVTGFAQLQDDGSWGGVSDRRMKTDIAPAEGLLAKAMALRPSEFYMKGQDCARDPDKYLGLIAQDVQPILPALVHGRDTLTLNYDRIGVVAIGAIQEQQAMITSQKKTIEEQQSRIRTLESQAASNERAIESWREASNARQAHIDDLSTRVERLESLVSRLAKEERGQDQTRMSSIKNSPTNLDKP